MHIYTMVRLLFMLSLPFLFGMYCSNDDGMDFCRNNFDCIVRVPQDDSVWIELYSGDTLLEVYSMVSPLYSYARLPHVGEEHNFRKKITLRIHIFCNKKWQEAVDYEFENRKDKYTNIDFDYFDIWHEDSLGIQILSKEFLTECPELAPYRIFKNTNHPPSCFVPEISPNQHR